MRARLLTVVLVLAFADASSGGGQTLARSTRIVNENDSFDFWIAPDKRTDDNYTQGARITRDLVGVPAFARRWICRQQSACGSSLEIGQEMYTPTRDSVLPSVDQRSYAGWLYARGDVLAASAGTLRDVGLIVGVTGPASLAQYAQDLVHRAFWPYHTPLGWKYQLPTEPDMALQFTQGWRIAPPGVGARWTDFLPTAHATLGTLRTAAGAGGRLRTGYDLDHPWLVDAASHRVSAYVFVGGAGEAVARDLFLDGDTFRPSLRRYHRPFIADLERGVVVRIARLELEYRAVTQSKDYPTAPATHSFGGITVGWWTAR